MTKISESIKNDSFCPCSEPVHLNLRCRAQASKWVIICNRHITYCQNMIQVQVLCCISNTCREQREKMLLLCFIEFLKHNSLIQITYLAILKYPFQCLIQMLLISIAISGNIALHLGKHKMVNNTFNIQNNLG